MRNILVFYSVVFCFMLSGCTHVTPRVSSMNFSPEAMESLGTGYGESTQGFLFCVIPSSVWATYESERNYSVVDAVEKAVQSRKGDALINTIAEHETGWFFPFWCWNKIRVHGTVVKFKYNIPGYEPVQAPSKN